MLSPAVDVLFVGNSYSSRNALPSLVAKRLKQDGLTVEVELIATGGRRLEGHRSEATRRLEQPSDWLVLQEQSQIPGFGPDDEAWLRSRSAVQQLAARCSGQALLFCTWGHRDGDPHNPDIYPTYEVMQDRLTLGYRDFAEASGARLALVGEAFRHVRQRDVEAFRGLYAADGSHPSIDGTRLASLVIAAVISGVTPAEDTLIAEAARSALG